MNTMTLQQKLLAMTVTTVITLCLLIGIVLFNTKNQLMEDREDKVRNLVETAHSLVAYHESLAREGKTTPQAAQEAAKNAIRGLRYDKSEYFWIHDLNDLMVMHPIKPELDGKKLDQMKDPNGKYLFTEFNKVVKNQSAGFVDYYWPKPGSDAPVPKISYVKGFEPWGWVIGSGIYIDDVNTLFRQAAIKLVLWGLLIGGFIAVSLALVSRNIIRTLGGDPKYATDITRRIASGDLSGTVTGAHNHPESLLAGISNMQDNLRTMIGTIVSNAEQVADAAKRLLDSSEQVARQAGEQSDTASSMAASVEEMAVSIDQVRDNTREAHTLAQDAGKTSDEGSAIIHSASSEMHRISEAVQSSSTIIEELGHQSDQITSIVKTIREIADQTNLLALNAAIEAARAGEQGRGFAVVADEVRKLAERTSLSTTEIAGMVEKIQSGTRSAVGSMQAGVTQVAQGVALANQAGEAITRIRDGAERVSDVIKYISEAIREQSAASNQIAQRIEQIAQMSEESATTVRQTTEAARHLQSLSSALHDTVARFKMH